jgi:hypothetical protein
VLLDILVEDSPIFGGATFIGLNALNAFAAHEIASVTHHELPPSSS